MQTNFKLNKAGVSLIAVLLFMLIATIAATATWKWITSEGFSSTSRMLKREAYQSSMAGIENTRSWMTFHANDVGALIKQYIEGGNVPVNIDAQLRPLQRAGQNYHVWLTGVNTENRTYKLKILSSGEARGGSKHSEVAIFNVDGLYQVTLPVQKVAKKANFDYAYFGGSYNGAGDLSLTSAVVNGDWHGNPQTISKKFIVTGNAMLSGNTVNIGELACVGGSMKPENNGLIGHDLFVNGDFTGNIQLTGNAYFNKDVSPSSAGEFTIAGNTTLNGILTTVQSEKNLTLSGNLCMAENAKIISHGTNYTFTASKNVWMPGDQNLWYGSVKYSGCTCKRTWCSYMGHCLTPTTRPCTKSQEKDEMEPFWGGGKATYTMIGCTDTTYVHGGDNFDSYDKIVLGGAEGSKVYMKSGYSWSEYKTHRENTKVVETKDAVAHCNVEPGVINPLNHVYCHTGPEDLWKGETYYPYLPREGGDDKEGLHYSFSYNGSGKEVDFDEYTDSYWLMCNEWKHGVGIGMGAFKTCADVTEGVTYGAYYVAGVRYWDGYDPEAFHPHHRLNHNGTNPTGSPYCTDSREHAGQKKYRVSCDVTPWFKSDVQVTRTMGERQFQCAEEIPTMCDEIWEKKPGCDGSSYKVDDVLVTAKAKFEPYAEKGCAANIKTYDKDLVTKLNECYNTTSNNSALAETNLYNGYLVVKVSGGTNSTNPTGTLTGKFIIIAEDALYTKLPPTGDNTFVFLYLKKGANTLNDATVANYFIYTEGDISNGNQFNLTGSVYATAESCAGIGKLQSSSITYSSTLVNELTNSGIICDNDGGECGGIMNGDAADPDPADPAGGAGGEEVAVAAAGIDAYYVSMAPQLSVSLESQYKNKEPEPAAAAQNTVDPSFIVLPRVIYMPSDPYGELSDYYSVIPLNGSTLKRSDVNVLSCAGAAGNIPTAGKLYNGSLLSRGIYRCEASAANYNNVPFWVVVGNEARGNSPIVFERPSYEISANDDIVGIGVNVIIPPHGNPYTLRVQCSDNPNGDQWKYSLTTMVTSARDEASGVCTFEIPANSDNGVTLELFRVKTTNATTGSVMFSLLQDQEYQIGNPATTQVQVASSAVLSRVEADPADITAYCNNNPGDCPPADQRSSDVWPNCTTTDTWVEPIGASYSVVEKNKEWKIVVGSAGTLKLTARNTGDCIAIIPDQSLDLGSFTANTEETLPASLKARKHTLTIAFVGEMGSDHPVIDIAVTGRTGTKCTYSADNHSCEVNVYNNEEVSLYVDKTTYPTDNAHFSYWKCNGPSCPDAAETITSVSYPGFKVTDDNTTIYAHFNESDKHCFFDEFKSGSVACGSLNTQYCIDRCGTATDDVCAGVVDAKGVYTNAKWHLISGKLSNIDVTYNNISIERPANRNALEPVVVLSTVNAGVYGTMKALFQLPHETSSFTRNSPNIMKSGFMLHSNATGTEFLMLNMFVNRAGYLESQLCTSSGNCQSGVLLNETYPATVYASSMIMMSATLMSDSEGPKLSVTAFTGNYYSDNPTSYSYTYSLGGLGTSYNDETHEFVGFSLADPNFKLYGIGWKSDTYSSECHDTYPTVKCSFAAVADHGVIPTATDTDPHNVTPWVGHSGWFDSHAYTCQTKFYYYNGGDACGGSSGNTPAECTSGSYSFANNNEAGQHGYTDNAGNDVKTAKAWINCTSDVVTNAWATTEERANCGPFWTGHINECSNHVILSEPVSYVLSSQETKSFTLTNTANFRATTLSIVLENTSGAEVEVWLESATATWGAAGHPSKSVIVRGSNGSFDVNAEMVNGSEGFDPEHVSAIHFKNHGSESVKITSVTASCKNAVDINSCSATYSDELNKWVVLVDVANKDNISSYTIDAKVDGLNEFSLSSTNPEWSDGKAKFEKADNPYLNNQGKSYQFTASVLNKTGTSASKECSVSPETIGAVSVSCSISDNVTSVTQGQGLPQFSVSFSNCPRGGCPYEIYLESTPVFTGTAAAGNSTVNKTADGNGETSYFSEGTYKYIVRSPSTSQSPFTECTKSFTVVKAAGPDIGLQTGCGFRSSNIQPGADAVFYASNGSNVANKDYKLVYMVGTTEVPAKTGNMGSGTEVQFNINGVHTIKDRSFTLLIKDTDGSYKNSCVADLDVNNLSPTCTKINDNGTDKFRINFSGQICNGSVCTYNVKKTIGNTTTSVTSGNQTLSMNQTDVTMNGVGDYVLWLNDEEYTTCKVTNDPVVTCPTAKQNLTKNSSVSLMMSDLKNCGDGCDYDLNISVTGTIDAKEENGLYTSKNTPITFTTPDLERDDVDYTFTVYAHADHNFTKSCTGKMKFVEGSTCASVEWTLGTSVGNTGGATPSPNYPWKNNCATITINKVCTGEVQIKAPVACENKTGKWNGVSFQLEGNGPPTKRFVTNPAPNLVNNLEINDCDEISYVYMTDCETVSAATSAPTIDNCPTSSITVKPGRSVSLPMTLSNCKVTGGCSYTISASGYPGASGTVYGTKLPDLGGASVDKTTVTYALSVSNSEGSASTCTSFNVYYDSDAREVADASGNQVFGPGKYKLYCYGQSGTKNMQPSNCNGGADGKKWFNPAISFYNDYGGCNGQASVVFPIDLDVPAGGSVQLHCW